MSATTPRLSVVVLPFANLSGDPAQDYFSDGITEGLIHELSKSHGHVRDRAQHSSSLTRANRSDVKQIGRDLGVRYVLEGSEQQAAIRSGWNARSSTRQRLASMRPTSSTADLTDCSQMQDEIVTGIASALIKLTQSAPLIAARGTENAGAGQSTG